MIDLYCERLTAEFWAEPVNAISNLAFIAAALCLLPLARHLERRFYLRLLTLLVFVIGIGSGLFHTFATRWAMLSDVIPILLFQLTFLCAYSDRVVRLAWYWVAAVLIAFLAVGQVISSMELSLNGSDTYLAPLLFLSGLGVYHLTIVKSGRFLLLIAAFVFLISLTLRTIDSSICEQFPLGTHFFWHLFNALVLYLCVKAYVVGELQQQSSACELA